MKSIPELELVEMERSREISWCCGGGEGRFWTETVAEERFSSMRVEEALGTGADVLVTGCPFCVMDFEDGLEGTSLDDPTAVLDLTELLLDNLREHILARVLNIRKNTLLPSALVYRSSLDELGRNNHRLPRITCIIGDKHAIC